MPDRSVTMRFRAEISDYVNKTRQMGRETAAFSGQLAKAAKAGKLEEISRGAAVAGGALTLAFGVAVKSAADFEQAMSRVDAATHASSAAMGQLREAAIQAGADTAFSASEAAQAEEALAKAGVSVRDIINGGLAGALDLAAAGELSVGEAAETAATAMTQFHLAGSQIPHVADLLAAGAGKAQGDVHDMSQALNQAGLVASQFGLTIEETTGGLSAFASAGLLGSDAGTSFKTMLLALANPSKESAALMKQLGIHAYDAQGRFVGLAKFAGQLHTQMAGLTDAQRQQALATIFGSDAIRSASVLYDQGAKGITAWENKTNDAGYAADTAARKMDNLSGDLEKLRGSLETALIKSGSGATGVLREFAQSADTSVDALSSMPSAVSGTVTVLVGLTGVILGGAGAFGTIAPKIRSAREELEAVGPAGQRASKALGAIGKAGAIGAVAAVGFGLLATAGNALSGALSDADPSVGELSRSLQKLADTGKLTGPALRLIGSDGTQLSSDLALTSNSADGLVKALRGVSDFQQRLGATVGYHGDIFGPFDDAKKHIDELDKSLAAMVQAGYADQVRTALVEMASRSGVSVDELRKQFPQMQSALKGMAGEADRSGGPMDDLANSMHGDTLAAQAAADAVSNFGDKLHNVNDPVLDARDASIQFRRSLKDLKKGLDDNGASFKGNSDAALDNNDALDQVVRTMLRAYDATATLKPGTDAAARSLDKMRDSLIDTLTPFFDSRKAAKNFVDTVFQIPPTAKTKVSAPGARSAKSAVDSLRQSLDALHGKTVKVYVKRVIQGEGQGGQHGGGIGHLLRGGDRWGGIRHYDAGGIYQSTDPNGLYRFAEKGTGGEALVPRLGDAARSRSILDVAASWYGGTIAWPGGGGAPAPAAAGTGSIIVENHIEVGGEVTRIVRTEIREHDRGVVRSAGARVGRGAR